jgi:hypothetical protein
MIPTRSIHSPFGQQGELPGRSASFVLVDLIHRLCSGKARVVCDDASFDEMAVDIQELR